MVTPTAKSNLARRAFALVDVIVATIILGISLSVMMSLAGRAVSAQHRGDELATAAHLADEQLQMVLARGPDDYAKRYGEQGADELTFLDITASSDGRDLMLPVIETVAAQVFIPLTVGGGVRSVNDVRRLLNAGADKVSINTAAVQTPQLIADAKPGVHFRAP